MDEASLCWSGVVCIRWSPLTSLRGAEEIRVRTPLETPLEDSLYLMHCFLGCVSNTTERSSIMDLLSCECECHLELKIIGGGLEQMLQHYISTPQACTYQSFFLEHPFTTSCQLYVFFQICLKCHHPEFAQTE